MYHPRPVISRLISDIFPEMIVRSKFYKSFYNFLIIMIPNLLSVFGQNFNTFAELLSFFSFCSSLLCGPASCVPLGSVGLQKERYRPISKSCLQNHLTLVHLICLDAVTYTVYNTCSPLRGSQRGPNSQRWNQTWGSLAGKRGKYECSNKRRHRFSVIISATGAGSEKR